MTPERTAKQFVGEWASGRLEAALQFVAEDAVYALHIAGVEATVGPETVGRQNIEAAFRQIGDQFEYLAFR
ncbi:MAG: hypothetical protein Q8K85_23735, partial [Hyphomicrobium sp.]|nr:hypothetical protein [Hyphomicrobium sp.]